MHPPVVLVQRDAALHDLPGHPESQARLEAALVGVPPALRTAGRGPVPRPLQSSPASTRPRTWRPSERTAPPSPGSATSTPTPTSRPGRTTSRGRRRGSRSRRRGTRSPAPPRSRWCGRRATTRSAGGRWASASSTTSPSRRPERSTPSGGSRSSTGTSTTETGRRPPSTASDRVLYCSVHRRFHFPGSGWYDERGTGDGTGYTLNAPLAAGSTGADYRYVFESVFCPAVTAFGPDLVLVSAGQDPLAGRPPRRHGPRPVRFRGDDAPSP